jgi:carboxyl-terminal processing protease
MKSTISFKRIALTIGGIIIIVGGMGGGYYAGFTHGLRETKHIIVEGVSNPQQKAGVVDFNEFWNVWNILKSKYVSKTEIENNTKLLYGAIDGLVNSLDDPYTVFLPPQDAKSFTDEISGAFGGIGAEIGYNEEKEIVVVAPLKNTPAERAGLQAKDRIMRIDDLDTAGLTPEEAAQNIRGERGTVVTLTILRNGEKTPQQIRITRDIIIVPTLEFKMIDSDGKESSTGKIAYIKLYNFYEKAPLQFQQAAVKSILLGAQGIILDVRNNPGGYLQAAQYIAGWFLPKGDIVVTEAFQDESENQSLISEGPSVLKDKPVIVLINKGSASASEIVAGALQDNKKAIVMGEKSFGKGTVQELIPLGKDGSMIKVTIAHWLTPNGNIIDKNGIIPDIELTVATSTQENEIDPWVIEAARKISDK